MLLSLDASLATFSWCIAHDNATEGDCLRLKHYESLPNYLESQLDRLKILPTDISKIAIIIGPGNYTGLRATLALVRTWHMLYDTPVICKNRLETMLYHVTQQHSEEVMISQSVRMDEFFILKGKAANPRELMITQELLKINRKDWASHAGQLSVYGDDLEELPLAEDAHWNHLAPVLAQWAKSLDALTPLSDMTPLYIRQAAQQSAQRK